MGLVCWSVPDKRAGYLSQIVVLEAGRQGFPRILGHSRVDESYSAQIRFVPQIRSEGLSLALVQRQTGAGSSELDVIGKQEGHFADLLRIGGFQFDIARLEGSKLPLIIAHRDASILDVPAIYRWDQGQFLEDSALSQVTTANFWMMTDGHFRPMRVRRS